MHILLRVVKPLKQLWKVLSSLAIVLKIEEGLLDLSIYLRFFLVASYKSKLLKDLLSKLQGILVVLDFNLQKLSIHVQKFLPKFLKRLQHDFPLSVYIEHQEPNFVLFLLRSVVKNIRVLNVGDQSNKA